MTKLVSKPKNNVYPLKDEVIKMLEHEPTCYAYNQLKKIVASWKEMKDAYISPWRTISVENKQLNLKWLCSEVSVEVYDNYYAIGVELGDYYSYNPKKRKITLGPRPSIISTLHELAHVLNGPNEKEAIHISLSLFKHFYPISFSKLKFKDNSHVMVKQ